MNHLGLLRAAAAAPALKVANVEYNVSQILLCAETADRNKAGLVVFPELCLTGATCGDLFYQDFLYRKQIAGLETILEATKKLNAVLAVGFYLRLDNSFYNCAAFLHKGLVLGIVPKSFLTGEESRWFASGLTLKDLVDEIPFLGQDVPFGNLIFTDEENGIRFGAELGADLWQPVSPGAQLCLAGAQIICCPSSDYEVGGSFRARKNQVQQTSASGLCGYIYAASGAGESTADLVHAGSCLAAECGKLLTHNYHFLNENVVNFADFDLQFIALERNRARTFEAGAAAYCDRNAYAIVDCGPLTLLDEPVDTLFRPLPQMAFLPEDSAEAEELCDNIFDLQAAALVKRLQHTHAKTAVIGVSGGLDSTLALLVLAQAFKLMKRDPKDIIAVTMPGFGTTDHTYQNALSIMELLGTTVREVPIRDAVLQHFKDIGHDPAVHDTTYENSQARERTQILMDISNKEGGLVIGTGDLSEMTLGWCTYNGDHMSMYGVNGGVPKTMIRFIIGRFMARYLGGLVATETPGETMPVNLYSADDSKLKEALQSILDTPISPELLPPDESGNIAQKTEDSVGPYILHDFFIYHTLRCGASPRKLLALAEFAFRGTYDRDFIKKWMTVFYRRFFNQQFKRNCVPDGPKIGTVGLSPRGDWRMPSDAEAALWLQEVDEL